MNESVISLTNVSKYFKLYDNPKDRLKEALHPLKRKFHTAYYALNNLNLEVKKGEVLGVVGRNGCGKSTLLKVITGVLQANEGSVSIKGKITALLELGAGFNPEFSGIDNIQFYARILGMSEAELAKKLPAIIEFAELEDFIYQPVKTYSSGMKSRLGFAVAVHVDPEILILDEVLAVGDAGFQRKCYNEIEKFFAAGKTVILVSHSYQNIVKLCSRTVLLHEGSIIADGKPKDVFMLHQEIMLSAKEHTKDIINAYNEKIISNSSEHVDTRLNESLEHATKETLEKHSAPEVSNNTGVLQSLTIRDHSGQQVKPNGLIKQKKYQFSIKFKANTPISNANFGFQIRTLTGFVVTGANQWNLHNSNIKKLEENEEVEVNVDFNCLLNHGDYTLNVYLLADDELTFICNDHTMIKVNDATQLGGVVDLIEKISPRSTPVELHGQKGGAWTEGVHKKLHPTNFNHGMANHIVKAFDFNSVLEFGSGLGLLAKYISENKAVEQYDCIEPNKFQENYQDEGNPKLIPVNIFKQDLEGLFSSQYDLVCSIEVAEHIPRDKHDFLFDFLAAKSKRWVIFSGARIGQGGHGHIAERDEADWRSEFTSRGFIFDQQRTADIRAACDTKNINHRRNVMVFQVANKAK
ncbi:MAG: ABC-type polysaccharide/polyol phosphate transport system ATPase subunit [Pseudomonadales bacterium]|jgi:ABC-type polysaccharide/polyol phosphate transport system ATPase subunit